MSMVQPKANLSSWFWIPRKNPSRIVFLLVLIETFVAPLKDAKN